MGISSDFVEQVRENCDFEELIQGRCQQVRRNGARQLLALCPFHQEKTPSFHVNLELKRYYCFGCKAKGDVFSFLMETERLEFPEAVRFLARRCGVPEPEEVHFTPEERRRVQERRDRKERLLAMHAEFAKWYMQILRSYPDSPVHRYFLSRGLPWDTADRFMIGASPDSWDASQRFGCSLGFSDEEMLDGGILAKKEETDRVYDNFRNRLMFPIWDEAGRVVGFSARTIEADHGGRKYVNTSETPIFKKGNILYALPWARDGFKKHRMAILCEGQLDAIALHRAGFDCAVAPQGTGFTAEQAKLLSRYTRKVLLCFDADGAGRKATMAALEHLLPLDFEVRSTAIAGGKDPDELLKTEGPPGVTRLIEQSVDLPELIFRNLEQQQEIDLNSPFGKDEAVKLLEHHFGMLSSPVVRDQYWQLAAQRLGLAPEVLYSELRRLRLESAAAQHRSARLRPEAGAKPVAQAMRQAPEGTGGAPVFPGMVAHAARTLFEIALTDEAVARRVMDEVPHALLEQIAVGRALNWLGSLSMNGEWAELPHRLEEMVQIAGDDPAIAKAVATEASVAPEKNERAVGDCINALRQYHGKRERERLKQAVAAARGTPEEAELMRQYLAAAKG